MTLSTISKSQQLDEEFHQQNLALYYERKKQKEANQASDRSVESRLASLEAEVQKLKEKIECAAQ
jgi:uncharacterized protein YceH (UPF0502 family)